MKTLTLIITLAAAGACTHALAPPRSQSEIAIRTDPVRALAVFNRVESLPDHAAEAEFAAGFQRSSFHPSTPGTSAQNARMRRIMRKVLRAWPVPLRGYDYSVRVVWTDMPNAFTYGDGRIEFTSGMVDDLGMTDLELEMVMAHEIAHNELRHSNRMRRILLRGYAINAAIQGLAAGLDQDWMYLTANLVADITNFGFAGFSRDREREADALARLYLDSAGIGPAPVSSGFGKMSAYRRRFGSQFQRYDAYATHPATPERISRANETTTLTIEDSRTSIAYDDRGQIRGGFQPLQLSKYGSEVDVIGVLTTPPYDRERSVGSLQVRIGGRVFLFQERTAENAEPGTSTPVIFRGRLPKDATLAQLSEASFGPEIAGINRWETMDLNLFRRGVGSVWAKPERKPASEN